MSRGYFALQYGFVKTEGCLVLDQSTPLGCIVLPAEEGNRPPSESARLPQAVAPPTFEW